MLRSFLRRAAANADMGPMVTLPGGLKAHVARGPWSSAGMRERYYMHLKMTTDPFLQDFFFKRFVHLSCSDPNSYGLYILCSIAWGICVGSCTRHLLFNPEVYFRRQENLKPMPDRHRQYTYALPFHNHNLRNRVAQYRWTVIDNEPDYLDKHPLGLRPNRIQAISKAGPWHCIYSHDMYPADDPLFTSCSHENMKRIYNEVGYTKEEVEEEE